MGHQQSSQLARRLQLSELCDRFEVAWRNGQRPAIEDFLLMVADEQRSELLHKLLPVERTFRVDLGESPSEGEYAARFPEHTQLIAQVFGAGKEIPVGLDSTPPPEPRDFLSAGEDVLPSCIGHYKLLEKLGEGGFGTVWAAEQSEPIRRRVALKVIKLGMDTKQVVARFEAERQALAMMDYPNIAKVFDAGATETGRPFFVMELVRGIPITEYCDQEQLRANDRLALFIQVCHAIQHAHQKGIIHRDIKPSNILVTWQDPEKMSVPKVLDFGLAKATQGALTDKTIHTGLEQFIGTPAYMSPEQADRSLGAPEDIDTRSDIYSLGVLLYELLVGKTPLDTRELKAAGIDGMRRLIRDKEPLRPSSRLSTLKGEELTNTARKRGTEPPKLISLLRGDLDWIVMKCLEKDRRRRYETANGLALDIQRYLRNEPILARPPSAAYRVQKAFRRNKLAFSAGAAVLAALVTGTAASTWMAIDARRARDAEREQRLAAITERNNAQSAQTVAERAKEAAVQQRLRAEAGERTARRLLYAADVNLAQRALAVNYVSVAVHHLDRHRPPPSESDFRGWEWRYLWQFCQINASFPFGHFPGKVNSLAVSPDGKQLAVGGGNGEISVWDIQRREPISQIPIRGFIVRLAYSPKEPWLAIYTWDPQASQQHKVHLWDCSAGGVIGELLLDDRCTGLAFAHDGQLLVAVTAHPGNQLYIWRVPGGAATTYHAPQVWSVGTSFALASRTGLAAHTAADGEVRVVDLHTGAEYWKRKVTNGIVTALEFSADEKILACGTGYNESSLQLWDVTTGIRIADLVGHTRWISDLVFWPDGNTLASASADHTIRLWNISSTRAGHAAAAGRSQELASASTLRGHRFEVHRLVLLGDNMTLLTADKGGSILGWDTGVFLERSRGVALSQSDRFLSPITLPSPIHAWCFAADGKSILAVDRQGEIAEWRGHDFQEAQSLLQIGADLVNACLSPDGRFVAALTPDGVIQVWDVQQRAMRCQFKVAGHRVRSSELAFRDEGKKLLVICQNDWTLQEWDVIAGQLIRSWSIPPVSMFLAVSPDERWCFLAGHFGGAVLIDLVDGAEKALNFPVPGAEAGAFSPDGKLVAVTGSHDLAKVLATDDFQELRTFGPLNAPAATFSSDAARLVTGTGAGTVKLWDVETFQELLTLPGTGEILTAVGFSPDGNVLAALSRPGVLHLWRAPSWVEIDDE